MLGHAPCEGSRTGAPGGPCSQACGRVPAASACLHMVTIVSLHFLEDICHAIEGPS